jgi:hypothetical protein
MEAAETSLYEIASRDPRAYATEGGRAGSRQMGPNPHGDVDGAYILSSASERRVVPVNRPIIHR